MPRAAANKQDRSIEVVRRRIPQLDDNGEDAAELFDADLLRSIGEVEGIQDAAVRIFRQGAHGKDLTYIDDVPPANFTLTMLKHPPYNGGKFRVLVCGPDGTFMKNSLIQVEPAPKLPEPPAPPPSAPVVQQLGTSNEAFVLLAKAMTDGFSRLGELIVSSRVAPPPPRSTEAILAELTQMKTLFDHPQPVSDPLDTVTKLLTLMKEMPFGGGGDGGEPGPMAVLLELAKQFGPRLLEAHDQAAGQPVAVPRRLPAAGSPAGHGGVASPAQPGQPERKPNVQFIITQQLKLLVKAANADSDPEAYAVVVLDTVPQPVLDSFLKRADWFEEICRYVPDAGQHQAWFAELKAAIDEYLTPEDDAAQTVGATNTDGNADGTAAPGNGKPDTPNT